MHVDPFKTQQKWESYSLLSARIIYSVCPKRIKHHFLITALIWFYLPGIILIQLTPTGFVSHIRPSAVSTLLV